MESFRDLFVFFGALIIWTIKGFKGNYGDIMVDDENYLHFFIGLVVSMTLIVLGGRLVVHLTD